MAEHHSEAALFPLFMFSVMILVLIPATLMKLCAAGDADGVAGATNKEVFTRAKAGGSKKKPLISHGMWLAIGWALAAAMLYYVSSVTEEQELFEPFDILGIGQNATDREIKSAYRKLSLKYHPDKNPDPVGQAFFVEKIQKAYKALTDETARANLKRYGHPDGPQGYSVGVALPSWLLDKNEGQAQVLILLGILLVGIIAPGAAAVFYLNRSEKYTTQGVKRDTLGRIAHSMRGKIDLSITKVLPILVCCSEYTDMKYGSAAKAEALQMLARDLKTAIERDEKIKDPKDLAKWMKRHPCVVKAHLLLLAYLNGSKIPEILQEDAEFIVKAAPLLLEEMVKFAMSPQPQTGLGVLRPALSCLEASQSIVRGVPISSRKLDGGGKGKDLSPLLQLPHVTEDTIRQLQKANVRTLKDLMDLELDEARAKLETTKLAPEEVDAAMVALGEIPHVHVDVAFATPGCSEVQANDLSSLYVRLCVWRRQSKPGVKGGSAPTAIRSARFPAPKAEAWHVYMADAKRNILILKSRAVIEAAEELNPAEEEGVAESTSNGVDDDEDEPPPVPKGGKQLEMMIRAPGPGEYSWDLIVECDSWIGVGLHLPVRVKVGQQQAADAVRAKPKPKRAKAAAESTGGEIEEDEEEDEEDDPVHNDEDDCISSEEYEDDEWMEDSDSDDEGLQMKKGHVADASQLTK
eukprot:PRCOL_00006188-RA